MFRMGLNHEPVQKWAKKIFNVFLQVITHTNAMAHTLFHIIEYCLNSMQLTAESSWI
jgi:hypothetical protein